MTTTRSQIPASSIASLDFTSTVFPRRPCRAGRGRCRGGHPTSTPCVGSSARITFRSPRRNGRISATFCWLPPERYCVGCSIEAALSRSRATRLVDRGTLRACGVTKPDPAYLQHLQRGVGVHAEGGEDRLPLAVGAEQDDPGADGAGRGGQVDALAGAGDGAVRRFDARQRAQQLDLPVALGAGDADDLAAPELEVDRPEPAAAQLAMTCSSISPRGARRSSGRRSRAGARSSSPRPRLRTSWRRRRCPD